MSVINCPHHITWVIIETSSAYYEIMWRKKNKINNNNNNNDDDSKKIKNDPHDGHGSCLFFVFIIIYRDNCVTV